MPKPPTLLLQKLRTPCLVERRVANDRGDVWKRIDKTFASIEPYLRGRTAPEDGQGTPVAMFDGLVRAGTKITAGDRLNCSKGIYFVQFVRSVDSDPSVIGLDLIQRNDDE